MDAVRELVESASSGRSPSSSSTASTAVMPSSCARLPRGVPTVLAHSVRCRTRTSIEPATLVDMDGIEVVVAHSERATLRVGDVYLKVDADARRLDREVEAMALAPVPTAPVLWRQPSVVALGALRGERLARLGRPSSASAAAWRATGLLLRRLHDAPLPPWAGHELEAVVAELETECRWLETSGTLPPELVRRGRAVADAALRPWTPAFAHGDLQADHVHVEDDAVTGVLDWSEAGPGDPLRDVATISFGHAERLGDLLDGYGVEADLEVVRGWWCVRSLLGVRWLLQHGFDPFAPGCEVDVLRAQR